MITNNRSLRQRLHDELCALVNICDRSRNIFFALMFSRIFEIISLYLICAGFRDDWVWELCGFTKFILNLKFYCDILFVLFCLSQSNWVSHYGQIIAAYYKIIFSGSIVTLISMISTLLLLLNPGNCLTNSLTYDVFMIDGPISVGLCAIDLILIGLMFWFKYRQQLLTNALNNNLIDSQSVV